MTLTATTPAPTTGPELTTRDHLARMMEDARAAVVPDLARRAELHDMEADESLDYDERAAASAELEELGYGYENYGVLRYCDGTARVFVAVGGPAVWYDFDISATLYGWPTTTGGRVGGAWGFSEAEPLPMTAEQADAAWELLAVDAYLDPSISDALEVECAERGGCDECRDFCDECDEDADDLCHDCTEERADA